MSLPLGMPFICLRILAHTTDDAAAATR